MADDVGSLLLGAGMVATEQLDEVREYVGKYGGTVPEELVRQAYIDDEELTSFFRARLLVPRIDPVQLGALSVGLIARVPADMAGETRSVPVSMDSDGNLVLAMSDPSDTKAADEIGFFTGCYVMRAIATQAQIAWCLATYYEQETNLFLDLKTEGHWDSDEEPSSVLRKRVHRDTLPMPMEPIILGGGPLQQIEDEEPAEAHLHSRPSDQHPSPPELYARAGEIFTPVNGTDRAVPPSGPTVVLDLENDRKRADNEEGNARRKKAESGDFSDEDTEPILLLALKKQQEQLGQSELYDSGPILLAPKPPRNEEVAGALEITGVPSNHVDNETLASVIVSDNATVVVEQAAPNTVIANSEMRSVDMVGGDWGAPGTTIPPQFIGANSSTYDDVQVDGIPVAVDEEVTGEIVPGGSAPKSSEPVIAAPAIPDMSGPSTAAHQLLVALRAIDKATDKEEVIEPILRFLDLHFAKTGFLALRQDDLVSWRLHNCGDSTKLSIYTLDTSILGDAVRTGLSYYGSLDDEVAQKLAKDLDVAKESDLLVLPMLIRERVIGVILGLASHQKVAEEHLMVLIQAGGEAFEKILLARKKPSSTS